MSSAQCASASAEPSRAAEAEERSKAASRPSPSASRRRAGKEKRSRANPNSARHRARLPASELHGLAPQVLAERLQHVRGEAADGAFLDGDEHLVFAREPKQ